MERAIAGYSVSGRYAVAVTDLETGETASVNGNRKQLGGCSMNLFVLLQATVDMQAGRYPPETVDVIDELIRTTTWSSNAATARDLYATVGDGDIVKGVSRVDLLMRESLGLRDSVIDHPPLYPDFSLGRGDNWLTALEANKALVALWKGAVLAPEWRAYLLARLAAVKPGLNYLTGVVGGAGVTVSHKNGFFEYGEGFVDNDVGIVRLKRRQEEVAFAITFLSEGVATKYGDVPLAQELVRLAFDHFSAAYE
jgi:beta-lactamase class A